MGRTTHGKWRTPEYSIWSSMKARCSNKNHNYFYLYGGRGIKVCKRWEKFEAFLEDMGERPGGDYTLDRIDNEKGYSLKNCRWATREEQMCNRRGSLRVNYKGKSHGLKMLCKELGYGYDRIRHLMRRDITFEEALGMSEPLEELND